MTPGLTDTTHAHARIRLCECQRLHNSHLDQRTHTSWRPRLAGIEAGVDEKEMGAGGGVVRGGRE